MREMTVNRVAWIVTVLVALLTALLLLLSGYNGYAGLGLAVAISAAINLLLSHVEQRSRRAPAMADRVLLLIGELRHRQGGRVFSSGGLSSGRNAGS